MKKIFIVLLGIIIVTGCGSSKKNTTEKVKDNNGGNEQATAEKTVMKDQLFEGLEFVNVGASNGVIKTIVINNTGYVYEGSKFKMTIMDENGVLIAEEIGEVTGSMAIGTTKEVETKTSADLSKAASIEYSIVIE